MEWTDITKLLEDATTGKTTLELLLFDIAEMAVGQLIHRENFGLMEAMSALEVLYGSN